MTKKKYGDKYEHAGFQMAGRALERQEQLAIFGDRLELWNEADLPFGLEPEAIKQEHASRPRNLLISELFFRLWGGDPGGWKELPSTLDQNAPKTAASSATSAIPIYPNISKGKSR